MSIIDFLLLLLVAGICGTLGQKIAGYSHSGCLVSIVLGFIGALVGTWLARLFELPNLFMVQIGGQGFPIIWSIIGAAIFVAALEFDHLTTPATAVKPVTRNLASEGAYP